MSVRTTFIFGSNPTIGTTCSCGIARKTGVGFEPMSLGLQPGASPPGYPVGWWVWRDSNPLSPKAPRLQRGPALQLRRTPMRERKRQDSNLRWFPTPG